ncbi:MAG: hypothetical protein ABEL76_09500 [Bradymonadaceae bacterium]
MFALATMGAACGNSDDGGSGGNGPDPPKNATPKQMCTDFTDAAVEAAVRCGQNRQQARREVEQQIPCDRVVKVENKKTLYKTCIGWLQNSSCDTLNNGSLPSDCKGVLKFQ